MNRKSDKAYMVHYFLIQALYWLTYCTGVGYISVLLLDCGYTNSNIGIILAISNIIAFILQPLVAAFADRHSRIELKNIITVIIAISCVLATVLTFTREKSILMSVTATALTVVVAIVQPLANSLSVAYERNGVNINFGLTRSGGSFGYAFISIIMGALLKWLPTYILPATTAAFLVVMALVVYNFKRPKQDSDRLNSDVSISTEDQNEETNNSRSLFIFIKENKRLMIFIFGIVLVLYNHVLISNYMMQIILSVGGDSSHMGVSSSIAAICEPPAMILFNKLRKKFGCTLLLRVAIIGFAIKNLVIVLAGSVGMVYVSQVLQLISFGLFIPAVVYYISKISGPADSVKGQSLFTSACTLAGIFASLIGGWLLDAYSAYTMLLTGMVVTIAGAIVVNISLEKVE